MRQHEKNFLNLQAATVFMFISGKLVCEDRSRECSSSSNYCMGEENWAMISKQNESLKIKCFCKFSDLNPKFYDLRAERC